MLYRIIYYGRVQLIKSDKLLQWKEKNFMFIYKDNDVLTKEQLMRMYQESDEYQDNEYLKYLVDNQIVDGITYKNFKKIWRFISKKEIYEVYEYSFLNLICKNIILLYADNNSEEIDKDDDYDFEYEEEIEKANQVIDDFYTIIDSGNLKIFDSLINIIMENNNNQREKIKLMIDIVTNFSKYIPLAKEIIQYGSLDYTEKYALIELLKFDSQNDEKLLYNYEEEYQYYEREFFPDDETIKGIVTLEDFRNFIETWYLVQTTRINNLTQDDFCEDVNFMIKNEITKLLTNTRYYGNDSLDVIGFETAALQELKESLNDQSIKDELSRYIIFMQLIDSILHIDDLNKLKVIACRIAYFKKTNKNINTIYRYTEFMAKRIKEIYAQEIKEKLINFNNLSTDENPLYTRVNSKFVAENKSLYGEDISGRTVDYIELSGINYVSLVHVLNAYGEGSTLKDFKTPRIIGKEYICLSAIYEEKNKIARTKEDKDEEHVCLLFSNIEDDQLITESYDDLNSYGRINSFKISSDRRESFRPIKNQIKLNKGAHTEFVLYRVSSNGKILYPSGILIQHELPTQAEINAAAYLNIPIVFINREKYNKKSSDAAKNSERGKMHKSTTEDYKKFKDSLIELRDFILGKGRSR